MADPLLVHLAKKVDEEIKVITDDLAKGSAKDFGDYKWSCGTVRGLMVAKGLLMELAERMDSDDD
jgi:hypothetical protein